MAFAIKAKVGDPQAETFCFPRQKTMYGGKLVGVGAVVYVFASENDGGRGLIARARVVSADAVARTRSLARETPRVSIVLERTALATRPLGRIELKRFDDWHDGRPESELNFKFYRQATNKIVGVSEDVARFLESFF